MIIIDGMTSKMTNPERPEGPNDPVSSPDIMDNNIVDINLLIDESALKSAQ